MRHGSSAWLWKITARSRLGPSIAWLSTITVPADGCVEAGQDVEHGGLAAAGMADDAGEVAALHRQPQVLEHRGGAAARRREALGDALDRDEFLSAIAHSGNVTSRVSRASIRSSSMPTTPISRIALITFVIDKLFHSFQTK